MGARGGTATDGGSVALVVRGQRHENWVKLEITSDVEGKADSHQGGLSVVRQQKNDGAPATMELQQVATTFGWICGTGR
jgi:prophage tail gpP-like protein